MHPRKRLRQVLECLNGDRSSEYLPLSFFLFCIQTLLSLSKLALLASGEEDKEERVKQLNDQLHHIEVQQSLPVEILEVRGKKCESKFSLAIKNKKKSYRPVDLIKS